VRELSEPKTAAAAGALSGGRTRRRERDCWNRRNTAGFQLLNPVFADEMKWWTRRAPDRIGFSYGCAGSRAFETPDAHREHREPFFEPCTEFVICRRDSWIHLPNSALRVWLLTRQRQGGVNDRPKTSSMVTTTTAPTMTTRLIIASPHFCSACAYATDRSRFSKPTFQSSSVASVAALLNFLAICGAAFWLTNH
jgi:hypothetical protein